VLQSAAIPQWRVVVEYVNMAGITLLFGTNADLIDVTAAAPGMYILMEEMTAATRDRLERRQLFLHYRNGRRLAERRRRSVFFNSFQNLLGGGGAARSFSATVSRSPERSTVQTARGHLDYSAFGTGVTVNLMLGSATGVLGGVTNIQTSWAAPETSSWAMNM
jgi:hypothetical protein